MRVKFHVEIALSTSTRARQVGAMFDCPAEEKSRLEWDIDLPIRPGEGAPWNVGLVVGPSGSGKSSLLRHVWGEMPELKWAGASIVDDFAASLPMESITGACSAVGFNTIPAWMRPFRVLSNGERFRVDLARRLLELPDPIVVDEFSSVVDRQVAKIGSHAVQKFVRKNKRQFVAIGCHYDVIDWLQPDWVLDMATRSFTRRSLQRRPPIDCVVGRLPYAAWRMFAPFHYMSAELHHGARCFGLWCNGALASFIAVLPFPHPKVRDIRRISRAVTLPDWQGLGLLRTLIDTMGAAYAGTGMRLRGYPAHPVLVRAQQKWETWRQTKEAGTFGSHVSPTSTAVSKMGTSACAVFEYCGAPMPKNEAERLIAT
jgi:energy-coupling factor transporter ATP-binding protein EcfA2